MAGKNCLKIWIEKCGLANAIEHLHLDEQLVKIKPNLKIGLMEVLGEMLLATVPGKKVGAGPVLEGVVVYRKVSEFWRNLF